MGYSALGCLRACAVNLDFDVCFGCELGDESRYLFLIIAIIIPFHFSELERGLPPPTFSCKEHLIFFTAIVIDDFLSPVMKVSVMEK